MPTTVLNAAVSKLHFSEMSHDNDSDITLTTPADVLDANPTQLLVQRTPGTLALPSRNRLYTNATAGVQAPRTHVSPVADQIQRLVLTEKALVRPR